MHSHATTSNVAISRINYFDTGTEHQTYSLFTQGSKLVNYGGKMVKVYGPVIWNSLPYNIQDSCSVKIFKNHLKNYFLSQYGNEA